MSTGSVVMVQLGDFDSMDDVQAVTWLFWAWQGVGGANG